MYKFTFQNKTGYVRAVTNYGARRKLAKYFGITHRFFEVEREDIIYITKI